MKRPAKQSQRDARFFETLSFAPMSQGSFATAESLDQVASIWVDWAVIQGGNAWRRLVWDVPAVASDTALILTKLRRRLHLRLLAVVLSLAVVVAASVGVVSIYNAARATTAKYRSFIDSPSALLNRSSRGITLTDRSGAVLYQAYGASTRHEVSLSTIPKTVIDATLSAEDPHFYDHSGFSWRSTARAIYIDLAEGSKAQGGSTITQQLIKNTLLTPEKSITRKFQEIVLSIALEKRYSKNQILEMYLNRVYYGQNAYGIESAAQTYYHKPASALTLSESALLAGLPQAPSQLDPAVYPEAASARRDQVLGLMQAGGRVTVSQVATAKAEHSTAYARSQPLLAPHFVFYVLSELRRQYGDDVVENDGMVVRTTLDLVKQSIGERTVAIQVARLAGHHATNGGLVSVDPTNGQILAMVGSIDYYTPGFGSVNITTSKLQPGSSFKPLVYAAAFASGWNGATMIEDKPMSLPQPDGSTYTPNNYDGLFRGQVTLRRALANSLNIPALHVLEHVGLARAIDFARSLGITTLGDSSRYGVSLVLGSGEVRPLDMAAAYSALASGGMSVHTTPILSVTDRYGVDMTPVVSPGNRVMSPQVAAMITDILADNGARSEEFGANSPLRLSRPAAAKTGTTNDFRDNWTVGYTPSLVTAVWVGNNDHTAMAGIDGISGAAPIWHDYMEAALSAAPVQSFARPDGLVGVAVCGSDGGLANAWDSPQLELLPVSAVPTRKCASLPKPKPSDPNTPVVPETIPSSLLPPGFHRWVIIDGQKVYLP
jgi:1A family penicillin-binding protein